MKYLSVILIVLVLATATNAEEKGRRGIGFAYRSAPIALIFEGHQSKKTLNLLSFDLFTYRISKNRFLGGVTFVYGAEGSIVEYAGLDIYGGKSYNVIPKIFHADIRVGIASATLSYDTKHYTDKAEKIWSDHMGGFAAVSLHLDIWDGSSFYAEWEIRGLSESPLDSNGNVENYGVIFNNSVPSAFRNFSYHAPFISQGIRLGYKLYF